MNHLTGHHYLYVILAVVVTIVIVLWLLFWRRYLSRKKFDRQWKDLQLLLADKSKWKEAMLAADKLLDKVLKRRHFKGKTMGERLVDAQHDLSANEMVWFSHKLSNKLISDDEDIKLNKQTVKKSLLGYWKALKDLGAFKQK